MKKQIVAMGDGLWDLFPDGPRFGGATANYACHTSILGAEVFMVSGVGEDDRGKALLQVYQKHGVCTEQVQVLKDYPTGVVHVELNEGGLPTFRIEDNSAWDHWQWNEKIKQKVKAADALYFGTLGQRGVLSKQSIIKALKIAFDRGVPRILDINLRFPFYNSSLIRKSVELCSVLKLSDEELIEVMKACDISLDISIEMSLKNLRAKYGLDLVVMTKGCDGALLVSADDIVSQPGFKTDVVDTVGAGDSFTASMTLGLLEKKEYAEILSDACKVAANVCSHRGAVPQ